jgi:uncharacterized membrane protein
MLFFSLSLTLSAVTVRLGEDYYGVGYFAASFVASLVALIIAERTFATLNYLTFIGNNPSIVVAGKKFAAERHARSHWQAGLSDHRLLLSVRSVRSVT